MENRLPENIIVARAYSSKEKLLVQFTFVNYQLAKTEYFKIENGQQVLCDPPHYCNKYYLSFDFANLEKQFVLEVKNLETGETVNKLEQTKKINLYDGFNLIIRSADTEKWKEVIASMNKFSQEEKTKFKNTVLHDTENPIRLHIDQVVQAIEAILAESTPIPSAFFKNINQKDEFGIERFILDRMYHLPDLIEKLELSHLDGTKYVAKSEKKDSAKNSVRFEHRFQATSDEEATKLFNNMATKQAGIWQKIWLACWLMGNKKGQFTYSCNLTELMYTAYPQRLNKDNSYFSTAEKVEFYEHLKSIEQTRFVFSKTIKKPNRKIDPTLSYIIPLISITQEIRENDSDRYPEQLTVSLRPFEPEPQNEKIYHVGAAIKNKTLELHADDAQIAGWLQTRKGQRPQEKFITVDRDFLIKLAGLQGSDSLNKTVANKRLLTKLKRLQEKGILNKTPDSITKIMQLNVR